ncbi:MAG: pyridoxamine 5'-phosphate oxidase family protein, partial [Pseudomonadota bacterium]|nr:pyridoxamine 5'-phosphate oxidase family protein [Pseudomonadota bacterium]
EARALARGLIDEARYGALAENDAGTGLPKETRDPMRTTPDRAPQTQVSNLSHHTRALKEDPRCSLLVGEPGDKGDPLTHPRLTLMAKVRFVNPGDSERDALAAHYLASHPKSKLYIDFPDFCFAIFEVDKAYMNGGFARAYELTPEDLGL